jgi:hypothetical protein
MWTGADYGIELPAPAMSYQPINSEAVAALRERGYLVRRLEDGYPQWKAAGLPVETAA